MTELLRLVPDIVRLLTRLARDRQTGPGTRLVLLLVLLYLAAPIDLVPDFVPGLGYADDVIVICVALRFLTRKAGLQALQDNWPGTPQGLDALIALAGLRDPPDS